MATMIVTHRVSDFDSWKKAYESHSGARANAGFTGASIHRDHLDPNLITVVLKNPSLEAAKTFAGSPDLRETMQKAGVQGPPEVKFLEDV